MWMKLGVGVVLLALSSTTGAVAHSWYPTECCDNRDCEPAEELTKVDDLGRTFRGIKTRIEIQLPAGFAIRPSPDGKPHICVQQNSILTPIKKLLCVFLPPQT